MHLGILTSHPIQYHAPWFRALARVLDLEVFFCHRQSAAEQGRAGFGVAFDWDVDLLSGYRHRLLKNVSARPGVDQYSGCDTPEIDEIIKRPQDHRPQDCGLRTKEEATRCGQKSVVSGQRSVVSGRSFDAFIVMGWHLKSYWQAARACRRAGVAVLVRGDSQLHTPRSRLKRVAMELVQRWRLRQFDGFLSVGKRNREYLEHFGVSAEKIFFVPHFVDNEWFAARAAEARGQWSVVSGPLSQTCPPFPDALTHLPTRDSLHPAPCSEPPSPISALRSQWGAGDADFVVLFVGKFIPKKRPADLLRALSTLNSPVLRSSTAEGGQPSTINYLAVFVGSGQLENTLRAEAAALGIRAHFAGFKNQSELPRYYAGAAVLVLPSESETWGLVVNEAMACSLPAIVSDAAGCAPDLIDDGKTGFTYPVGDCAQLARRLESLAELKTGGHDFGPALAEKMRAYSVNAAVEGTVRAMEMIKRRQRDHGTTDNEGTT
jgi:glycosyltransferase involved in cell wall biosynthesis